MSDQQQEAVTQTERMPHNKRSASPKDVHNLIQSLAEGAEWDCNAIFDLVDAHLKTLAKNEPLEDEWMRLQVQAMMAKLAIKDLTSRMLATFAKARDLEVRQKAAELADLANIA